MNSKRAGTLFALTLTAGTLGVAGSASAAECGTPAVDAVYETVSHPALSHVEIRWTRTVVDTPGQPAYDDPPVVVPDSYETRTVEVKPAWDQTVETPAWDETVETPAWDETVETPAWTETVVTKDAWTETVVVTPAQPAVYQVLVKWVHKTTGAVRWEPQEWNGASVNGSWLVTTETMQGDLISPAVPAVTTVVNHPAETTTVNHPAETTTVNHPAETTVVHHAAESKVVHHPAESTVVHHPAETTVVHHPAVTEEVQVLVPGYTIPGAHHEAVEEVSHLEEQWAAESPGSEWADSGYSRVVIDEEAWDETVLVTPEQPAGPECPTDPEDPDDGGVTDGGDEEVVEPATPSTTGRTTARPTVRTSTTTTRQASALPARLAHTGSDAVQYALVGVFLLAGGVALTVRGRRLED